MPKLNYLVFAESWAVDSDTNRLSIFNIISDLYPERFPARVNKLIGIAQLLFEEAELNRDFQLSLEVVRPGCEVETPLNVNMTAETEKHVALMRLRGMPVSSAGRAIFRLKLNGTLLTEQLLHIHDPSEGHDDEDMFRYSKPGEPKSSEQSAQEESVNEQKRPK